MPNKLLHKTDGWLGFYCPECEEYFSGSFYLETQFRYRPGALWLANFITHYRHNHTDWDKQKYKLNGNKVSYKKGKSLMNEYIKQLLINKFPALLKENDILLSDFELLENTNNQTINLYKLKILS